MENAEAALEAQLASAGDSEDRLAQVTFFVLATLRSLLPFLLRCSFPQVCRVRVAGTFGGTIVVRRGDGGASAGSAPRRGD